MNNFENLKNILVSAANQAGIEKYEIYYQSGSDISAETLKQELSNFSFGSTSGICFRCIVDGKVGYASTELMDEQEMYELVKRASTNARFIDTDSNGVIFKGSDSYGIKTSEYRPLPDVALLKSTALQIVPSWAALQNSLVGLVPINIRPRSKKRFCRILSCRSEERAF